MEFTNPLLAHLAGLLTEHQLGPRRLSPPPGGGRLSGEARGEVELVLAAKHRQLLRNTAVSIKMQMHLARLRGAKDEASKMGQELDKFVKDIAQIDRLYPNALAKMKVLEEAPNPRS